MAYKKIADVFNIFDNCFVFVFIVDPRKGRPVSSVFFFKVIYDLILHKQKKGLVMSLM